ncbi:MULTISPECIES: hypothetical protein [Crocosphaera]|nr:MULTISPECIES: hypothetical protein [Crocosphaera]MCH2244910.1 hypothetical protein [Crocosphaera sp.]NQZ62146.1 hypothetical protein [Crocosphaera sp.]
MKNYQTLIITFVAVLVIVMTFVAIQDHSITDFNVTLDAQNEFISVEMHRNDTITNLE